MSADYWREMGRVVPTMELVVTMQNCDIKFEAYAVDSLLTLPEDRVLPPEDAELSLLELRLNACGSGLPFRACFAVAGYVPDFGTLFTSNGNIEAARCLNDQIRGEEGAVGVFGGQIDLAGTFRMADERVILHMGYAEFPKDSGIVYVFDREAPFITPSKF